MLSPKVNCSPILCNGLYVKVISYYRDKCIGLEERILFQNTYHRGGLYITLRMRVNRMKRLLTSQLGFLASFCVPLFWGWFFTICK